MGQHLQDDGGILYTAGQGKAHPSSRERMNKQREEEEKKKEEEEEEVEEVDDPSLPCIPFLCFFLSLPLSLPFILFKKTTNNMSSHQLHWST
jgi:hypothetical protein